MRFSNVIDGEFNMDGIVLHEFPIVNLPDITYFAVVRSVLKNGDIPYDRISKSVNLRNIQMGSFLTLVFGIVNGRGFKNEKIEVFWV